MESRAADLVQKQLDAYNAQNLEEFLSVYSEDVEIRDFPSNNLVYKGIDKMRERYGKLFKDNPQQHAQLLGRIEQENFVIDHEKVTGRSNGKEVFAIAMYETDGAHITKVWFKK
ncbi:nuclear transport factor 2 family protein [Evansella sp. LMS18]|uniref:nuclear transport factor 2 family protein n=1 Tax=Evansella sp. LMS18 TaxID=2924033 RepID=UPI0020D0B564|nr:nuclear transport factor 2 family protein [Evansella sp. LMS18]UTR09799.1 nuclear transport factor 2 family protein [Evansella sp. LMS18]